MELNTNQTNPTDAGRITAGGMFGNISYEDIIEKDLLELMDAKDMPPEEKIGLYKKMMETIENRVFARIDDQLSDEDVEKVKALVEAKDKAGFLSLLADKGIDVNKIYMEEALIYKMEMVDLMNSRSKNA